MNYEINRVKQYEQCILEMPVLREELLNLKHCQVTFLTFTVIATGILLGLGTMLGSEKILGIVFLFPLIIILPAWWIFFDKASTITRIVGYYRILEKIVLNEQYIALKFEGWENNLRNYRYLQYQGKIVCPEDYKCLFFKPKLSNIFNLKTGHRYWLICYCIFFALSVLCITVSIVISILYWYWPFFLITMIAMFLFIISVYFNIKMVHKLIYGDYQYNCHECYWKQVIGLNE